MQFFILKECKQALHENRTPIYRHHAQIMEVEKLKNSLKTLVKPTRSFINLYYCKS